ncbi:hypothetical protein J5N97_000522 [Dioscorea zingiberensis]|uniref:Uncharacterized protein n=1 Tax=Dioscorea zingiberensis TaxID=325984 RepID=A0A9D5H1L7_9LILI|nr:hypothetical protein J5N97_000522 [Dioscorea zingiberensis]
MTTPAVGFSTTARRASEQDKLDGAEKLYQSAVALLVQDFGELKQKLVDLNRRMMGSNTIAALGRAYQTLKNLIIRNEGRMTGHEAQNTNQEPEQHH